MVPDDCIVGSIRKPAKKPMRKPHVILTTILQIRGMCLSHTSPTLWLAFCVCFPKDSGKRKLW